MDDIQGMIDRLPELSDADLDVLEGKIIQRFEAVEAEEITREAVNEMTFLADSVESVRAEMGRRAGEVAKLTAKASEAATRIGGEMAAGAEASEEEAEDTALTTESPTEDEAEEEVAPEAEAEEPVEEEEAPTKRPPITFSEEPEAEATTLATEEPEPVETEATPAETTLAVTEPEPIPEPEPESTTLAVAEPTPEPEPAALATEEVAAEATPAETTLAVAEPEPTTPAVVEPEPEVTTLATEPEPTTAEAAPVETTLAVAEPEPVETETAPVETTLAVTEPEPTPEPEATTLAVSEPEPVSEPEATTLAVAEPVETETAPVETTLAVTEPEPTTAEATPAETTLAVAEVIEDTQAEIPAAEAAEGSTPDLLAAGEEAEPESTEAHMDTTSAGTFAAPADRLPVPREGVSPAPITVIAGGDIPGITAGSVLSDGRSLSDAFSTRLHSLRRVSGNTGEQVVVASLIAQFPDERILRTNEVDANSAKIKEVTNPFTIVASGGWCAPLPVIYDIFEIGGSTSTPLRDALPVFNADRGGVRYVTPPVISDYAGAVGIWTNDDDIAAATADTPRKQCLVVQCAAEEQIYLDAVTMCMCFGNLQTRAFPELIARHNELALIQAARFEETYILDAIKAKSTPVGPVNATLGAGRDLLISVERAATAYRYTHRLDPALPLRFVAPQWAHAMIRSDITAQLPGDGMDTTFALADAAINSFFTFRNINPVWTLEGASGSTIPSYDDYPDTLEWSLFAEGTFTLLDGGTLDIGIVRDSELVAKNDYCMFTEQFLAVAKTGVEGLWVTQNVNVSGGSAGTLDVSMVDY